MGVLVRQLLEVSDALTRRAVAPEQAGIFAGDNPAHYNANNPLRLWVIQLIIIIAMTQFLAFFLSKIRQPRVIAEVIGGILLGPSVMGRIPNFSKSIFPSDSIPLLALTANIGLVLFLFLVGLEIDVRLIKRNAKAATVISVAGLVLPLGLGAAVGVPIYNQFIDDTVNFGYFILFTAVAIGITAFPVLCRILTELKLLDDKVGVVVLAAGVGNDVVGWVLLALTVALVNASSGLNALWVLLTAVGYTLFLLYPLRWAFRWAARRSGSLETGEPTAMMMTVTLLLVFFSAFFTDIIGVHAIFGGFLVGLIIPHDNGFAISLVEKFEDLVSLLFLPLYFTLSGLKTNLGLLDDGVTWGYTILICVVAFFSKFIGCAVTAKLFGFNLRESGAIGSLMSCKGLVELIVLNVGLSAGVLDTRTFSMFVLHALVLTFVTTPLTIMFYPPKYRHNEHSAREKARLPADGQGASGQGAFAVDSFKTKFAVILDRVEQLPAVMTLTQLLRAPVKSFAGTVTVDYSSESIKEKTSTASNAVEGLVHTPETASQLPSQITIDALRLIELTDRTSAVLKSQSAEILVRNDPILTVFRTFGYLNRMLVSTALSVVGFESFSSQVATHVSESGSQMVILPWSSSSGQEDVIEPSPSSSTSPPTAVSNPFDGLFGQKQVVGQHTTAVVQSQLIRRVFLECPADVALFVDRGLPQSFEGQGSQHLFLPFFGGPDDRLALSFVVQLCLNSSTTATVVRFIRAELDALSPVDTIDEIKRNNTVTAGFPDTVYAARDTQTRLASDTADNIAWERYTTAAQSSNAPDSLKRITFLQETSPRPLHAILDAATRVAKDHPQARLIAVSGRSRRMAVDSHAAELREVCTEHGTAPNTELSKTLGEVGAAFVATSANTGLLVLQAFHSS